MKIKTALLTAIVLLLSGYCYAQKVSTQGKEFYVTFPQIHIEAVETTEILVSSLVNTSGTVVNPLDGYSQSFTVSAGAVTTVVIPISECMNSYYETINRNGLIITTKDTAAVYAVSSQDYSSDASNVLPTSTLGTDYIISSYYAGNGTGYYTTSEFAIVATVDNTIINITPTANTYTGHPAGTTFTVTLNKGQTYSVGSQTGDLTGSLVSVTNGCNPIAIFSGDDIGFVPDGYGAGDYLYEQLFPIPTLGKNFIVGNLKGRNSSRVKIVAPYDNTTISLNGSVAATLNKGQNYEFEMDNPYDLFSSSTGPFLSLATDKSGNLYTGGGFYDASFAHYVAQWNGTTWTEMGALKANNYIESVITDATGNIYAAGYFTDANYYEYVAKWDGTTWQELGNLGAYAGILTLASDQHGNIYAAGAFTDASTKYYVAKWDGLSWTELGTGASALNANYTISAVVSDTAGNIYAAGGFTNAAGKSYVAKWNGTTWTELGTGSNALNANYAISTLAKDAAGNIYAAGNFTDASGYRYVAKWNGTTWTELGTGSNALKANNSIGTITIDATGNIYAAGGFTNTSGYQYVAQWNGSTWSEVGSGSNALNANYTIMTTTTDSSGNLYAAGYFTNAQYQYYVAKWDGTTWSQLKPNTNNGPVIDYISTTNPVQVMQYGTGVLYDQTKGPANDGDPTMITIGSLEQSLTNAVFALPPIGVITTHHITITTKTSEAGKTILDGNNIGSSFSPVAGNPAYSLAEVDAVAGTHQLYNPSGFAAYAYGFGQTQGYGYNIGSLVSKINTYFDVNGTSILNIDTLFECNGTQTFNTQTSDTIVSYTWDFGDGSPTVTTDGKVITQTHSYPAAGNYTVKLTAVAASVNKCQTGNTSISTGIINIPPLIGTITGSAEPCIGEVATYSITAGPDYPVGTRFVWTEPTGWTVTANPDSTKLMVRPNATAGTVSVSSVSPGGCVSAPATLAVIPGKNGIVATINITASQTTFCKGASAVFTAAITNGGSAPAYQWKVNGINTGKDTSAFTTAALNDNDIVSCVLTSSSVCALTPTATSNPITVTVTSNSVTPVVNIAASQNNICAGTSITFTATPTNGGTTPTYQWQLNGTNTGNNNSAYTNATLKNNDVVRCIMTSNAGCLSTPTDTSNIITMTINPILTPSVSIGVSQNNICAGTPVTFTATPVNGGSAPTYQWQLNGTNTGTNSNTYTSAAIKNNDVVSCTIISNALCLTTTTANSNTITMLVNPILTPTVSIVASQNNICKGTPITFTATSSNGGTAPTYQWTINGINAGTNNPLFTSSTFSNNDIVNCTITSNAACVSSPTGVSNNIAVMVYPVIIPSVHITGDVNNICYSNPVNIAAVATNGGNTPSYQWKLNNINVGINSPDYSNSMLNNGDIISCVLTSSIACTSPVVSNNTISMVVYPLPKVINGNPLIIQLGTSTNLDLNVSGNIATYLWTPSDGLSDPTVEVPVADPTVTTTYTLQVTTDNGCTASGNVKVTVFNKLVMPDAFTPNGDGNNDLFRIPPSIAVVVKHFTVYNRWGNIVFSTTNSTAGWDGSCNGVLQPTGSYVWILEYIDPLKQIPVKAQGNVLLIR